MFIADSNDLQEFVSHLLLAEKTKEVLQVLEDEDSKQLLYAKNAMFQKMPKELQNSQRIGRTQTRSPAMAFPSMFVQNQNKPYEYIQSNLQNMKRIVNRYPSNQPKPPKESRLPPSEQGEVVHEVGRQAAEQINVPTVNPQPENISFDKDQLDMSQAVSKQSFANVQKKNPFIANHLNFTNQYANSKSLATKFTHLSYSENSRNITSIAQSAKFNAFSQSIAYPTTVMTGTLLRPSQNTFTKDSKLDVADVMRYTLGVMGGKNEKKPIQNPFARPPRKRE